MSGFLIAEELDELPIFVCSAHNLTAHCHVVLVLRKPVLNLTFALQLLFDVVLELLDVDHAVFVFVEFVEKLPEVGLI